jgi:hypothetical protein
MSDFGYFTARVYTSRGEIPIKDASVVIENYDSTSVLGARVTDANGKITPIAINTPPLADSQSPGVENPFASVNVRISHPGFYTRYIRNAQVFEGETSIAEAELIPIDYTLDLPLRVEDFTVTPQNL